MLGFLVLNKSSLQRFAYKYIKYILYKEECTLQDKYGQLYSIVLDKLRLYVY